MVCIGNDSFAQFTTSSGNITQQVAGNVGIGIIGATAPLSLLEVKNGSVLFDGTTGTTPISGVGIRMMWVPAKRAFRAGEISGSQWDDASIGMTSFASGINTIASGQYSTAMGASAIASGHTAFSIGFNTTASGTHSNAFNYYSIASGSYASAFGQRTTAQAYNSFVIGRFNYNPGTYSTTTWVTSDPLFVIGNGTSTSARNNALTVLKNGNVLIDKATQINSTYKLDVNGKIRASEIVVNTTGADFVFEKSYTLMPLDLLEQKIKTEKHLPEIASAEEMQTNGVGLSELNTKLLQKTEELTLYIIELNKRIERLENKNK